MSTKVPDMPSEARLIVDSACCGAGVPIESIFKHWFLRTGVETEARASAMARLRDHAIDGNPVWTIGQICQWFNTSRTSATAFLERRGKLHVRRKGTAALGSRRSERAGK